jgi:hypothetical protein
MKDKKTSLTKQEKEKIKGKRPTRTMSAEEWAVVQGMTHAEFHRPTELSAFFDAVDEKLKNRR